MKILHRLSNDRAPQASLGGMAAGNRRLGAPSSGSSMLLAGAGFFTGVVILFADKPWWRDTRRFAAHGYFFWLFIILAETSIWPIAALFVVSVLRELRGEWQNAKVEVVRSAAILTTLVIVMGLVTDANINRQIVPGYRVKGNLILLMGYAVVLSAASGIWLIHSALLRLQSDLESLGQIFHDFLRLKSLLQSLLSVLVAILIGIILGSIAHRMAILSQYPSTPYPLEYIVVYGAFSSTLLGLVYGPAYFRMLVVGRQLLDAYFPITSLPASAEFLAWAERRKALEDVLHLDKVASRTIRAFGGVLAPLVSSIIGAVLGFK